jgi:hypothetical protein
VSVVVCESIDALMTVHVQCAYFRDISPDEIPHTEVPLHTLIEITPTAYSIDMKTYKLLDNEAKPH